MITPHEPASEQLEAAVRDRAGAVLIGPAGVGKTSLLQRAVQKLGQHYRRVGWVTGTQSASAVPFAAFSHLFDVPDTGKTAVVLREAREALGSTGPPGLLLAVDDAHLLDELSATLLYQLAVSGAARLIVTVAPGGPVPGAVSALWRDDLLSRIDIEPPGHEEGRLAAQVKEYVAALPPGARMALEYLAVEEPLQRADLTALVGRAAVQLAEASGAIAADGDSVRPAHPLYADAIRDALGGPDLRRLRTALVELLAENPHDGVVGRLRTAVLTLDSDRPQPVADVIAGAEEALRLGVLETRC
ncbi:MAG: hypothetical protein JWR37_4870 [Mycobacterium sp.]|nr:hypothetical protein [Mycobacterium sp.]